MKPHMIRYQGTWYLLPNRRMAGAFRMLRLVSIAWGIGDTPQAAWADYQSSITAWRAQPEKQP